MGRLSGRQLKRPLTARLEDLVVSDRKRSTASPFIGSGFATTADGMIVEAGSWEIPTGAHLYVNGGDVSIYDQSNNLLMSYATFPLGDRNVSLFRADGTPALVIQSTATAGAAQTLLLFDKSGRVIGGDAQDNASGIDAPYLPIRFEPTDLTSGARQQSTTSTSFVALFEHYGYFQNGGLPLSVKAWASDGSTSATVQLYDAINGLYLGALAAPSTPQTILMPTATTAATLFASAAPFALNGSMGDDLQLEIHVKRTAGAGTVNVAVARSIGRAAA